MSGPRLGRAAARRSPGLRNVATLLLLSASACAYSFSGSSLPSYVKTVAVANLGNETLDASIAQELTTALTDRFIQDARLKIGTESEAQARIVGRVVRYENKVYNYGPDQAPRDYVVVIAMAVELEDKLKNRQIWEDKLLTETSVYTPGASGDDPTTEGAARAVAVGKLASAVVTRTMEQW